MDSIRSCNLIKRRLPYSVQLPEKQLYAVEEGIISEVSDQTKKWIRMKNLHTCLKSNSVVEKMDGTYRGQVVHENQDQIKLDNMDVLQKKEENETWRYRSRFLDTLEEIDEGTTIGGTRDPEQASTKPPLFIQADILRNMQRPAQKVQYTDGTVQNFNPVRNEIEAYIQARKDTGWRHFQTIIHTDTTVNIIFGNPAAGKKVLEHNSQMATMMPMCLSCHQENDYTFRLTFRNPFVDDETLAEQARVSHNFVVNMIKSLKIPTTPGLYQHFYLKNEPTDIVTTIPVHLGKWQVIGCQLNGRWLPDSIFREFVFHIGHDMYKLKWSGLSWPNWVGSFPRSSHGKIIFDYASSRVDMIPGDGEYSGNTLKGIYNLDHDVMKIIFSFPDGARPTHFRAGQKQVYEIWRRL